jgi:predicted  nucleic acid-binding Zn-ribbon protein
MKNEIKELIDIVSDIKVSVVNNEYGRVSGLIERWQTLGNRMEAKLTDIRDFKEFDEELREKKKELKKLRKQVDELENKLEE